MVYIGQKCLNEELIKNGLAWVYKRYCSESFCNHWLKLEQYAQVNKLGLWIYDNPVPPWDFRRGKSNKSKDKIPGEYHGNVSSKVFHESDCKYFNCKKCTKIFQNRDSAVNAGYRPCGICKP
jgi:micrococcal nuclease